MDYSNKLFPLPKLRLKKKVLLETNSLLSVEANIGTPVYSLGKPRVRKDGYFRLKRRCEQRQ